MGPLHEILYTSTFSTRFPSMFPPRQRAEKKVHHTSVDVVLVINEWIWNTLFQPPVWGLLLNLMPLYAQYRFETRLYRGRCPLKINAWFTLSPVCLCFILSYLSLLIILVYLLRPLSLLLAPLMPTFHSLPSFTH